MLAKVRYTTPGAFRRRHPARESRRQAVQDPVEAVREVGVAYPLRGCVHIGMRCGPKAVHTASR
ncbi:hypothetical protein ACTMUQ_05800 [Streptomyces sp. SD11]|uniref:hypothetical protein n=1 Tax=Streptomyces sp. SD11 TaxID=3452209 RepID=UPI003F8B7331